MRYFSYNGKIQPEGGLIVGPDNRGLRYGDGLFETMKFTKGNIVLLEEHLSRLWTGLHMLDFTLPAHGSKAALTADIMALLKKNNDATARIRLTVLRGDGGLYDPANHHANFIIQTWPLATLPQKLNENGLEICVYEDARKSCDLFSNLKHNNFLCYLMGALHAKKNKCNDAIILNQHSRVCDSTIANIFIVNDTTITTPALKEGCVAGVMRQFFVDSLPALGFDVIESALTVEDLMNAEELFLTNSIFNMRWVKSLNTKLFDNSRIRRIHDRLCQTKGNAFC